MQTVLHPTDFSKRSQHAFHLACALARDHGARLVVLHVVSPPAAVYGEVVLASLPEGYKGRLANQLHQLQAPDPKVRVEYLLEEGDPAAHILRVAQEIQADLLVLGTHGRTGLSRLLLGSVAEPVLRRATCPVLTVKTSFPPAEPVPEAAVQAAAPQEPVAGTAACR